MCGAACARACACVQVCPKSALDLAAHSKCLAPFAEYEACAKRVAAGTVDPSKHCGGYYGEYYQCIDKANAKALFKLMK